MMSDHQYLSGPTTPDPIANIEAEAALLGALLADNTAFDVAIEFVSAEDFFEPLHGRIYGAIQDALAMGRVASPITLRPLFVDDPAMRELGGPAYLASISSSGAARVGTKDFARQVADLARQRDLHDRTVECVGEMADLRSGVTPAAHAAKLEAIAFEATASKQERASLFTIGDSIRRTAADVRKVQESGAPTGVIAIDIPEVRHVVGPMQRKHLTVLAGRPGMGKSGLLCGIIRSAAQGDVALPYEERTRYGCGLISLEMGDIDLGQRFAADIALGMGEPLLHAKIRDAQLDARQLRVLDAAAVIADELPCKLADVSGITISRLFMIARRMKRELEAEGSSLDLLGVDYLQLVNPDHRIENKTQAITEVSNAMKRLAKELDCHVLALSQLSRAVEQREDKRPQLSDLRESGAIEQDADNVVAVYRDAYYLQHKEPEHGTRDWDEWKLAIDQCKDHLDLLGLKRRGGANTRATATYIKEYQAVRSRDFYERHPGGLFNG